MTPAGFGSRTNCPSVRPGRKSAEESAFKLSVLSKTEKNCPVIFFRTTKILSLTKESGKMRHLFRINQNCLIPRTPRIFGFFSQIRYLWIRYILLFRWVSELGPGCCSSPCHSSAICDFMVLFQQLTKHQRATRGCGWKLML